MEEKEKVRIDKYLWSIRIFKTRSLATDACDGHKVQLNGNAVKPSKSVNIGEIYHIKTKDRKWVIKVAELLDRRKAYSEAVKFYEDMTPPEEASLERAQASSFFTGKRLSKVGRPTKKDRRAWDDIIGDTEEE